MRLACCPSPPRPARLTARPESVSKRQLKADIQNRLNNDRFSET